MSLDVLGHESVEPSMKTSPLVPDISPAQKAMIHEQLSKTFHFTQSIPQKQTADCDAKGVGDVVTELSSSQSKSQKIGRKIKGLFMNDQKTPSRQQSLDNRIMYLNPDEEDLYRFDGRTKNKWGM